MSIPEAFSTTALIFAGLAIILGLNAGLAIRPSARVRRLAWIAVSVSAALFVAATWWAAIA